MTVRYHCDGPDCDQQLGRDDRRIAIVVEEPPGPLDTSDEYEDGLMPLVEFAPFGDGDFHFCTESCLTAWAMSRALDAEHT